MAREAAVQVAFAENFRREFLAVMSGKPLTNSKASLSTCGWSPPSVGEIIRMNVDASVKEGKGFIIVGVVFRDCFGMVLATFLFTYPRLF